MQSDDDKAKEDLEIIARLEKEPVRSCYYIDVDKIPPKEVKEYIETIARTYKKRLPPDDDLGVSQS